MEGIKTEPKESKEPKEIMHKPQKGEERVHKKPYHKNKLEKGEN